MVVFPCNLLTYLPLYIINKKAIKVINPGIPRIPTKTIENMFIGIIKFNGSEIRL